MTRPSSALTQVPGFRAVGVACGLKQSNKPDLALVLADQPCVAAAVFTENVFKAAPVLYDLALLERSQHKLQAVVINAGNANAITGAQGLHDAEQMARFTETACGLPPDTTFVMSTGVIGRPMSMDRIQKGITEAAETIMTPAGAQGSQAAQAIMTTDLVPKESFVEIPIGGQTVRLGAIAKGSGMIHPQLGTMLAVIVTDAHIEVGALQAALKQAASCTFNRVSVDGDTSTNDTVVMLASGQASQTLITFSPDKPPSVEFNTFVDALIQLCTPLAQAMAQDGEGATKLLEITVREAVNESEAEIAAKTVATSPLVKTAMFGNDPNWGRILAAIGRSGVRVDPAQVSLQMGDFWLVKSGESLAFDASAVSDWLAQANTVPITVNLGVGQCDITVWSCDFSYKYVEINAEYHT